MTELSKMQIICGFPKMENCIPLHLTNRESCIENILFAFLKGASSCAKYYAPVYILQLALTKKDKLNSTKVKKLFMDFLRSVSYGGSFSALGMYTIICIYRSIFGTINIFTVLLVDITVGFSLFIENARNRKLNAYMMNAIALEVLINEIEQNNIIKRTPIRDTLKFMLFSGSVMYFLSKKKLSSLNFWFYEPLEKKIENENTQCECSHQNTCWKFLQEGFKKYFIIGYGWNIIKVFLKHSTTMMKNPKTIVWYLLKKENFKFGSVLGLYAVIYRFVTCNMLKIDNEKSSQRQALHSLVAGSLAGCTYLIQPNLQFGLTSIVTLLQIFYEKIRANTLTESTWEKIPVAEICFLVAVSYLNVSYLANTKAFQNSNGKFIYDTFSAKSAALIRKQIWKNMKVKM